jgi:hypothetical protein
MTRPDQPPKKPYGNPPKKTPAAAKKRAKTPAEKRMQLVRERALADQRKNNIADARARAQWDAMEERGRLEFTDRPTPEELTQRQRRAELHGLPLNELCENIAENEERRREEQRANVVPDPEGDAHTAERLQRAHDRLHQEPREPPSG